MTKTALIAQSEFLRRVRSKWFIATTLLAPVFALAVVVLPVMLIGASGGDEERRLGVVDETGLLLAPLAVAMPDAAIVPATGPLDSLRARLLDGEFDGALILPMGLMEGTAPAAFYAQGGLSEGAMVRSAVREAVRTARVREAGASDAVVAQFTAPVDVDLVTVRADGDARGGAIAQFFVANVLSLLVYIAILIYGALVMRGVIEEKANRIVEVIASSARPFELMMGKVLGIGAVGLTQLTAWGVLLIAFGMAVGPVVATLMPPPPPEAMPGMTPGATPDLPFDPAAITTLLTPGLMVAFVLFFLGGYLLFAGVFAAVGSMVDQESDAQTLQVPIMLPVMVPLFFLTYVLDQPGAPLSVGLSLFPLSSPVLMVARMTASDVPFWQVALSLALLAAAFVGVIALAARVYRVGILMTGKKATVADLWRWMRTA